MRRILPVVIGLALLAMPVSAQTAEEIIAKYIKTIGGAEKIEGIKTLRRTGKFTGGGGFEAVIIQEKKRPEMPREESTIQGMTGVNAYDGKTGWKIEPWQGKKDAEPLSEEELKQIQVNADFDGPLVNYRQKGNKVEFIGAEPVEGTDAFKLKVTLKNGDVNYYFMDTDYYVPIKVEYKMMVRGAEQEFETSLGDYKEVAGVYMPHSVESGVKGSPNKSQITFEKIEANVTLDDSRFKQPAAPAKPAGAEGEKSK
jgi:outer membrane lipoprotein-sorting protein